MTNVPPIVFTSTGFQAPAEADILTGVQTDIDSAFGGGLDPSLTTPQGQLATSTAAIIGNVNDTFVNMSNQVNPDYADGMWQDAIAEIYFLQRKPSQPTVVQALCTGGAGVVISAGDLAQAVDGNIYTCTSGGDDPGRRLDHARLCLQCGGTDPLPGEYAEQDLSRHPGMGFDQQCRRWRARQ